MRRGAPQAIQVADQCDIQKNVTEVTEQILIRHHAALRHAVQTLAVDIRTAASAVDEQPAAADHIRGLTRVQQDRQARRARRVARYREVLALNDQEHSQRQIAEALGIGRHVVPLLLRADGFPEPLARAPRPSSLRHYKPYLRERWVAVLVDGPSKAHTGGTLTVAERSLHQVDRWLPSGG